ncbi:MAG: 2-C-methyl-D-erythritol 4-phosphate cytidylyltransferase [Prevotella sp.]
MDYVIIVAGGKGLRMGADVPKQFLPVGGRPVLMRTIERFARHDASISIILVLPEHQQDYWRRLCAEYGFDVPHTIVNGGETRFHSSLNGLRAIPDDVSGTVGIHDGVRPFVSQEVIQRCYAAARTDGAAIPVCPVVDTLRLVNDEKGGHNVLRSNYRVVQTPQVFDIAIAKRAFDVPYREEFTDDASVVEASGHAVTMVDGNRENIKITTPFDLKIAEMLLDR